MSFFKKEKQEQGPKETNEIGNKKLLENLADFALSLLREEIDYENLAHTKVEFGYLFRIEDYGLEALFKIITDKTTAYFAVQEEKMMRLNLSEGVYQTIVEDFLVAHKVKAKSLKTASYLSK